MIISRRTMWTRLAWFGALWTSGVLSMGCVAGLLRWALPKPPGHAAALR